MCGSLVDCGLAIVCLDHFHVDTAQEVTQDLPIVFLVFDHEDTFSHAGCTCRSTLRGMLNENVDPCPSCESTHSRPPCISTVRFEIARPRPVPPFSLVVEESACWNSSKILR